MSNFRGAAALVAVAVVVYVVPARADSAAEKEARALFKEGNKALDDGNYVDALDMFKGAYARWPNPKILLNMGTAFRALGRYSEAADTYEKYLADSSSDPKKRPEVQKTLDELNGKVGKIHVEVNEPGAQVLVDGKAVGESPQTVTMRVDPGTHAVVAQKEGFALAAATVSVAAGEERVVQLRLLPPQGKPAGTGGTGGTGAGNKPAGTGDKPAGTGDKPAGAGDKPLGEGDMVGDMADNGDNGEGGEGGEGAGGALVIHKGAEGARPKLAAVLRGDMDATHMPAGAGLLGIGYALGAKLEVIVGGMRAGTNFGAYVGGKFYFTNGRFRPSATLGVPVVFVDGAAPAIHAAAGVEYDLMPRVGLFVDVGVQYFPTADDAHFNFAFTPSAGLQIRL